MSERPRQVRPCFSSEGPLGKHAFLPRRSSDGVNMEPGDFLVDMTWMVLLESTK